MKPPAGTSGTVLFPVTAQGGAGNEVRVSTRWQEKFPGCFGSGPVLFLNMTGGDLYIRGDGASCLYVRKDPDDPDAVH